MAGTRTTIIALRAWLVVLIFLYLTISSATTTPDTKADDSSVEASSLTDQPVIVHTDMYIERKPYDYCEADHPTLDSYPHPPVRNAELSNIQLFIRHGDRTSQVSFPVDREMVWECSETTEYNSAGDVSFHSSRTPHNASIITHQVVSIPEDSPYSNSIWKGSCIPGQLTPKGAEQHLNLGRSLRDIYIDHFEFLPKAFDPNKVYVRSTDFWRTRQSAASLLTGLYGSPSHPPKIQIHTLPSQIDYLVFNEQGRCPRITQLKSHIQNNSAILERLHNNLPPHIKEAAEIIDPPNVLNTDQIHDFVEPRRCHKMPMPCVQDNNTGENKCINDKAVAEELVDYWQTELAETLQDAPQSQELLKVGFGPVAALIHKNIVQTIKGVKEQAAFSLYSGHDTTLTPLLGLFKSDDTRWPPYASNLLIELWTVPSHSKDKYVRILYNNKVLTTKSKWCDLSWCPVKTFLQYLDQFLPGEDYLQKCQEGPIM